MATHRMRDLLLYIVIGILVAFAAIAYGIYAAKAGKGVSFKNDWTVTVTSAAIGFGYGLRGFWRFRDKPSFWIVSLGLLAAHFAILIPLLSRMEKVPLIWGAFIAPLDVLAIQFVMNKFVLASSRKNTFRRVEPGGRS